jgi:hypothetical protein
MFKKFSRMAALAVVFWLFVAQAFAQFEVSPDHFDAPVPHVPKKVHHTKTSHKTATAARTPSGVGAKRKQPAKQRKSA